MNYDCGASFFSFFIRLLLKIKVYITQDEVSLQAEYFFFPVSPQLIAGRQTRGGGYLVSDNLSVCCCSLCLLGLRKTTYLTGAKTVENVLSVGGTRAHANTLYLLVVFNPTNNCCCSFSSVSLFEDKATNSNSTN